MNVKQLTQSLSTVCLCALLLCCLCFVSDVQAQEQGGYTGPIQLGGYTGPVHLGGFTGPGPALSSVKETLAKPHKTWVVLKGSIVQSLGKEYYLFADQSGQIEIKIEDEHWRGLQVGPQDTVEIQGEFKNRKRVYVDVETIKK